ncbi:uncharacterized protein [Prorops nasuta]|uniref:uncharacterized protein isoform X2 n=1 Tax=Prorops nasuta TaxID=863751 RepID=UPI0034CD5F74
MILKPTEIWTEDNINEKNVILEPNCTEQTLMALQPTEISTQNNLCEKLTLFQSVCKSIETESNSYSSESSTSSHASTIISKTKNSEENWLNFKIPWDKMDLSVIRELDAGNRNKYLVTNVVNKVVSEMRAIQELIPSKTFNLIARKMVDKYPKTFADLDDDGQFFGEGMHSLYNKMHDRNFYLNRPHMKRTLLRTLNIPFKKQKSILAAKAGCSNWQPDKYKEGETESSLEEKRKFLETVTLNIDSIKTDVEKKQKVYLFLEDTYPIQRVFINNVHKPPTMTDIKIKWPILLHKEFFVWHYEKLMQQSIVVLKEQLTIKKDKILAYGEKRNFKNILNSSDKDEIKCIKIIMYHFKEDYNLIFRSFPEGTLLNELKPVIAAPSIAIVDTHVPLYYLYIEQVLFMRTESCFYEVLQLLMAAYFVFNLEYPAGASCTFEFIQKYLLKIHPDSGSKSRKSGNKSKVLSLFNKLRNIEGQQKISADSE